MGAVNDICMELYARGAMKAWSEVPIIEVHVYAVSVLRVFPTTTTNE